MSNCPYGTMPRSAGAGHWRDWHRGHGCDADPDVIKPQEDRRYEIFVGSVFRATEISLAGAYWAVTDAARSNPGSYITAVRDGVSHIKMRVVNGNREATIR